MYKFLSSILVVAEILVLTTMPISVLADESEKIEAQIELQPSIGPVGTEICMTGEGFDTNTEIVISFKTKDNKVVEGVKTDEEGCFRVCFTLEDCPVGIYGVWASWVAGDVSKDLNSLFTIIPGITLNKSSGYVHDEITVSGTGFAAQKDITIYFDNDKVATSKTNDDGTFPNTNFYLPKSHGGKHIIKAKDNSKNSDSASFNIKQSISLNPKSGPTSTKANIYGTGFAIEKKIIVYFDNDKVAENKTDAKGGFTDLTFHIPRSCNGEHTIKVEDTDHNSASSSFSTLQSISLNPKSGPPGTKVTITGTGCAASSNVAIIFDGEQVASEGSDTNGSFITVFDVPLRPNGVYYNIKASDGTNTAHAEFTIMSGISLSKNNGYVGMGLDINGANFPANEIIVIKYDDITITEATTTDEGTFSAHFNVPKSSHGDHSITATDGINTIKFIFTMESTPPPVPQLLLPEDADKIEAQIYLDWGDVEDPSSVTYTFQIASDADFTKVVLTKNGLTASEYTLTNDEKLAQNTTGLLYYWRVSAIDGASNESEWSASRSFVGPTPPSVPLLLLPEDAYKVAAQTDFDWKDVEGLSNVTYTFQISYNATFDQPLLTKKGLPASEYTLTNSEKLAQTAKETPYYWRVRAIDSASNASEWSASRSFYVGFSFNMPPWTKYILTGLGTLLLLFLCFLGGRYLLYRRASIDSQRKMSQPSSQISGLEEDDEQN